MSANEFQNRAVQFAVEVSTVIEKLPQTYLATHLSKQILRSSTAIALNFGESRAAESRKDFIHKMKVAAKEARETEVNLEILMRKDYLPKQDWVFVRKECSELVAILTSSVKTAESNNK